MKKRPVPPGTILYSKKAKKVFSGKRFDVYQWQQKQFDGSVATYEIVKREDTVIIIPILEDGAIIVREKQPHWKKVQTTLIAGMLNKNEDPWSGARRELEEETGMVFENFDLVYIDQVIPGVEWIAYTFIASGFKGMKDKKLDPGEKTRVHKVSFKKLVEMARKKQFFYRPRFIEDYLVQDKEQELYKVFKNPKKYAIK